MKLDIEADQKAAGTPPDCTLRLLLLGWDMSPDGLYTQETAAADFSKYMHIVVTRTECTGRKTYTPSTHR